MALWRSVPGGDARIGWRGWTLAALAVWLVPLPLGLAVLGLAHLAEALGLSNDGAGMHPLAVVHVLGFILLFSVTLSWLGVLIALLPAWALLRLGWGGWASFAALGLVAGAAAGSLLHGFVPGLGPAHGLFAALFFRWIIYRIAPGIFTLP